MPKRPREHELEAESRTAFKGLIEGRGWVVRPVDSPDYGLDDLVEVFLHGEATGLLFYVQVRGTDEPDLHKALAVRVRAEQQAYFTAVDHPVLVVRYQGGSRRLFGRWFHRFDPHPRHGGETLRLRESDELLDDRVDALAGEVRLYRAVSSAAVAWPLAVKVSSTGRHRARDAVLAMAAAAGSRQRYVRFVAADEAPDAVGLTSDLLVDRMVVHGGRSSLTLHGDTDDKDLDTIAADAVLAVGVVLGMMEHLDAAAALITSSAADAPSFDDVIVHATGALARGRRIGDALAIGRALAAQGRRGTAALVVAPVAMATSELMTDEELKAVIAFDEALADAAQSQGSLGEAAAIRYSLGNWLFNVIHDWEGALAAFDGAVALDGTYATRGYFMHERAGALFECERYDEAVAAYAQLVDGGTSGPETVAWLADAMLMAGRFADAALTFERYLASPVMSKPVWYLKAAVARFLVNHGYTEQARDEEAAFALVVEAEDLDDVADRMAKCEEALARDALCSVAWRLIAVAKAETDPRNAAVPMVAAALAARRPDLWAVTLLLLLEAGEQGLASVTIAHALLEGGPAFPEAIRRAGAYFGDDVVEVALAAVLDADATITRPHPGFTLRIPDAEGRLVEYPVRPSAVD